MCRLARPPFTVCGSFSRVVSARMMKDVKRLCYSTMASIAPLHFQRYRPHAIRKLGQDSLDVALFVDLVESARLLPAKPYHFGPVAHCLDSFSWTIIVPEHLPKFLITVPTILRHVIWAEDDTVGNNTTKFRLCYHTG